MSTGASCRTIGDYWKVANGRPAGFDNLRVVLAISIILWHTVVVCYGDAEQARVWAGPLRPFIFFPVPGFFALSGFLVAGSLVRNDIVSFAALRIIRIYPALIFEVLLSAFVIGVSFTQFKLKDYFSSQIFLDYMLNIIGWIHYRLPGVFLTNPYPDSVNLQLWTVPYELECYLALVVISLVGLQRRPFLLLSLTVFMTIAQILRLDNKNYLPLTFNGPPKQMTVLCFVFGVTCFLLKDRIRINFWTFVVAIVAYLVLINNRYGVYASAPIVAYSTIYMGIQNKIIPGVRSVSNYSYGIYLYGFPMQQAICYLLPQYRVWWINFTLSIICTLGVAAISWHLVEKPVDGKKKSIIKGIDELKLKVAARVSAVFPGKKGGDAPVASVAEVENVNTAPLS
jgi:peptidoglycan/LPS O-acetylase OafA/YrhL